jgi:hypothetical protein
VRDVTLDLTTRRATTPAWLSPTPPADLDDPDLTHLAGCRVTLGHQGDPLLQPDWQDIVTCLRRAGVASIHVETDLLCDAQDLIALATSGVEVVSVHLPAMTAATYAKVMGVNAMPKAVGNLSALLAARAKLADTTGGLPIVVPTFVKLAANVVEMEAWYDQWLRAADAAVIRGPDALGNTPPETQAARPAAPLRRTDRQPVGDLIAPSSGRKEAA